MGGASLAAWPPGDGAGPAQQRMPDRQGGV